VKPPSSFEYNVRVTKTVVDMAVGRGVSVEGELGCYVKGVVFQTPL